MATRGTDHLRVTVDGRKRKVYERSNGTLYYKRNGEEVDISPDDQVLDTAGNEARCKKCHAVSYCRECRLMERYGISERDYRRMWQQQQGKCCICKAKFASESEGCVDHNHHTKHVRGILCRECNLALGLLKDKPKLMRAAAKYLEERH